MTNREALLEYYRTCKLPGYLNPDIDNPGSRKAESEAIRVFNFWGDANCHKLELEPFKLHDRFVSAGDSLPVDAADSNRTLLECRRLTKRTTIDERGLFLSQRKIDALYHALTFGFQEAYIIYICEHDNTYRIISLPKALSCPSLTKPGMMYNRRNRTKDYGYFIHLDLWIGPFKNVEI